MKTVLSDLQEAITIFTKEHGTPISLEMTKDLVQYYRLKWLGNMETSNYSTDFKEQLALDSDTEISKVIGDLLNIEIIINNELANETIILNNTNGKPQEFNILLTPINK